LKVVKIDATDKTDEDGTIFLGTLSNGKKFSFIAVAFRDKKDGYGCTQLTFWGRTETRRIYVGNSYDEIIQLIKDTRSDALPRHMERFFNYKKIYP